jgi:hypothetical protein
MLIRHICLFCLTVGLALLHYGGLMATLGCGFSGPSSNVSTTAADGARLGLSLTSEVVSAGTTAGFLKALTFASGSSCPDGDGACFTPDYYFLGIQSLGLIRCLNSSSTDILCPGQTGHQLPSTQSLAVATLMSAASDRVIYQSSSAASNPGIGDSTTISATPVTTAGIYSGIQVAIDFIGAAYPAGNASSLPDIGSEEGGSSAASVQGYYALWCLNINGCAALSGYDASLAKLIDQPVQAGDIVFYHPANDEWYFWDSTTQTFGLTTEGRPDTTINTPIPATDTASGNAYTSGSNGEFVYNASFGSIAALNITQGNIQDKISDTLSITFAVTNALGFTGGDGDATIDDDELIRLKCQNPTIQTLSTTENAF